MRNYRDLEVWNKAHGLYAAKELTSVRKMLRSFLSAIEKVQSKGKPDTK